ncbi:MAG TPA: hypothetical protein VMU28_13370 [Terriglobales bacterium]|nr:hypothetical protein [Terriglobales bacterium]
MRTWKVALIMALACSATLYAGSKQKGTTVLKDFQPAGTTDKQQKNQIYDLLFVADGNSYTCRTAYDKKINAAEFIVGDNIQYQINGNKADIKNSHGKQAKCTVVRVEKDTGAAAK